MSIAQEVVDAITTFLAQPGNYQGDNDTGPEDFVSEFFPNESQRSIDVVDNGDTRWERHETHVFLLSDGSHVGIDYASGLTENQESRGIEGAQIVRPVVVTATEWVNA